jgi:hypothetical protein
MKVITSDLFVNDILCPLMGSSRKYWLTRLVVVRRFSIRGLHLWALYLSPILGRHVAEMVILSPPGGASSEGLTDRMLCL